MRHTRLILFAFIILSLIISMLVPALKQPVLASPKYQESAPQPETRCWPLDVVLLIDQSFSMFSPYPLNAPPERQTQPSDPKNYRYLAAKEVLDRLILNRLDECPEAVHRLGVVTFGDHSVPVLPLAQIDLSANEDGDIWSTDYRAKIEAAADDRSQGGTDPVKAFEQAALLFANADDVVDSATYGPRRKVVVLVTDGSPDGVGDEQKYMCRLVDTLNKEPWLDTSIWVLALNASSPYLDDAGCGAPEGTIRQDWNDVLTYEDRSRNGELISLTYNERAIPYFMTRIVDKEFGLNGEPLKCGEVFYIDPYMQQAQFKFFRNEDDNTTVTIQKLDEVTGDVVFEANGDGVVMDNLPADSQMTFRSDLYRKTSIKEEFIFEQPKPGPWKFIASGLSPEECQRRILAVSTPIKASVKLVQPSIFPPIPLPAHEDEPYYDGQNPLYYAVELKTDDEKRLPQERNYPLTVTAAWQPESGATTLPNGQAIKPVTLVPSGNNQWVSQEPILTPEIGNYKLVITGTTYHGDGSPDYTVFTSENTYSASNIDQLGFSIDEPSNKATLACNIVTKIGKTGQPVKVKIRLNMEGSTVSALEYLTSKPDESFVAVLQDENGEEIDSIPLTYVESAPGLFEGTLLTDPAKITGCGKNFVKIAFIGAIDDRRFFFPVSEDQVEITRVPAEGVLVQIEQKPAEKNLIHPGFCSDEIVSNPLTWKITNFDGTRLDPNEIAANNPQALYAVTLISQDPTQWEELTPTIEQQAEGLVFTVNGGTSVTAPGVYTYTISAVPSAFKGGYAPVVLDEEPITYNRNDTTATLPRTCKTVKYSGLGLALLAVAGLIFALTGGPGGSLEFVPSMPESSVPPAIRLPKNRVKKVIQNDTLKSFGIKSIRFAKAKSNQVDILDDGTMKSSKQPAVQVEVVDTSEAPIFNYVMEVDEEVPFLNDSIVYRK